MRQDPHLQKLVELVATNIKERFSIFGNAFRYLDFKNRHGVSLEDLDRGLTGFGLKLSPSDRRSIFAYLTDSDPENKERLEKVLMTQDQFMRLKDEQGERNVDPFELQIFHEQVSANFAHYEALDKKERERREFDKLSVAPSQAY